MAHFTMPALQIGDLKFQLPIIQGGMGVGISLSGLASAVSNAGGLGVISSVALGLLDGKSGKAYRDENITRLRYEINRARKLTKNPVGLNIMVAMSDYNMLLETAIEEEVDIVFLGAGLPLRFPKKYTPEDIKNIKTLFAPIVSSGRAAQLVCQYWYKNFGRVPDALIVEGPKAGGHLGFKREQIDDPGFSLENILPEVIAVATKFEQLAGKPVPVIGAGGIFDGSDILRMLNLGASGVQMATRFVATDECDASIEFKEAYVNCRPEDIAIIQSPVGLPGRAIRNQFVDEVGRGIRKPFQCSWKCLKTCDYRSTPYCIADALANAQKGQLMRGFTFAGANAWRVDKIVPVANLMDSLQNEYTAAVYEREIAAPVLQNAACA